MAVLAVLAYLPGARHGFIYDDVGAIVENAFLAEPAHLARVVSLEVARDPAVLDGQRPVLLLTLFADRWGAAVPQPWRHHATNLLLHGAASALLVLLVRSLGGGTKRAAGAGVAAGLVLALHPAWSEAVQLPSYREDLLALVFTLGFLLAARAGRLRVALPLQAVCLLLSAASKESAWAAPLLLVAQQVFFPAPGAKGWRIWLLPCVSLAVLAGWMMLAYSGRPLQASGPVWNGLALRWPENLWTAPWLWVRYLLLFLWPHPLVADRVVGAVTVWHDPRALFGLAASLAAAAGAWWLRRRRPMAAYGLAWLLIAFGPVSNLVPLFNPMADRYLYGLAPGFALLLAAVVPHLPARRVVLALVVALWVAVLQARLADWRSDRALWEATLRAEPRSARANTWLGLDDLAAGRIAEAAAHFERAESLNPQDVSALVNLAILDAQRGALASAEARLREALRRRPDRSEAAANLERVRELRRMLEAGGPPR